MGILDGKNIVVTGVLTDASLAYGVAKLALEQGAQIMLTGAGRGLSITERTARQLGVLRRLCASAMTSWQRNGQMFQSPCKFRHTL